MAKTINWTEGVFLQPHHFQQAFLAASEQVHALAVDYLPHFHGIAGLELSDCSGYELEVVYIEARFPDGTRILGGTRSEMPNAVIESRDFKSLFEQSGHRLQVYLGLPKLNQGAQNCLRFDEKPSGGGRYRFTSKEAQVPDLVAGANPQTVEYTLYRPRLLFRWQDKEGELGDATDGYDLLPIAELEMSAQRGEHRSVPQLRKDYVPPCTNVAVSPLLSRIFAELQSRLNVKCRNLREYWKHKDTSTLMKTQDTFKVQAVTAAALGLRQYSSLKRVHPFPLYVKLAEILGTLSIYTDKDELIDIPNYDHQNLGPGFTSLHANLEKLLAMLEEVIYEERLFETKTNELLICPLDEGWLDEERELFLCFESTKSESEVLRMVGGLKVAPEDLIPQLNERKVRGVSLEGPVRHISSMPSGAHRHYFKLPRDTIFYPKLKAHPILAVWGHQFAELVKIYMVDKDKI